MAIILGSWVIPVTVTIAYLVFAAVLMFKPSRGPTNVMDFGPAVDGLFSLLLLAALAIPVLLVWLGWALWLR